MNPANLVSCGRILLTPVFVWTLVQHHVSGWGASLSLALVVFVILVVSDWLDGFLARKLNCKTKLGEFLDPAADKLLMLGTIGYLCFFDSPADLKLPLWFGVMYITRDALLLILYLMLGLVVENVKIVPTGLGKATTVCFFTLILFLLVKAPAQLIQAIMYLNSILIIISLVIYVHDGYRQWKPKSPKLTS